MDVVIITNINDLLSSQRESIMDSCKTIKNLMSNNNNNIKERVRDEVYKKNSFGTAESLKDPKLLESIKKYDPKVFDLLEYCIKNNIHTFASCQGHPEEMPIEKEAVGYIGFYDLDNQYIENIINYVTTKHNNSHIMFSYEKEIGSKCNIYWSASRTTSMTKELINVINDTSSKIYKNEKTPEIILLMKELTDEFGKNNMYISISRKGIDNKSSTGGIDFYQKGPKLNQLLEIFKLDGFIINLDSYDKKIWWGQNISDEKVCQTLKKVLNG